jgi:hypothetical protein
MITVSMHELYTYELSRPLEVIAVISGIIPSVKIGVMNDINQAGGSTLFSKLKVKSNDRQ